MTAIKLPGQLELPTVIDHKRQSMSQHAHTAHTAHKGDPRDVQIAKLLRDYENRPSSETWSRIQSLANEILNNH